MYDSEERKYIVGAKSMNVLKVSCKAFEIEQFSEDDKP